MSIWVKWCLFKTKVWRKLDSGWLEVKFSNIFECCQLWIDSYCNSRYKIKKYNYACTFTFGIFNLSVKKFSILNIWFTYISFSSSNRTKCFEKDNCLVHMQIWCILATCSEAKDYPTSAFQLMLVSKIKKWLHLLLCNFQAVGTIQHFTKTLETL